MQPLDLSPDAPWKARFRAAAFRQSTIAPHSPTHGLVTSNRSGTLQWYAWDVPSGVLRQLTATPGGHASPLTLAPNGSYVYFLQDKDGNETGHYVRFPYAGGTPKDLTPGLPLYSARSCAISRNGQRLAFIAAHDHRHHVYVVEHPTASVTGEPRLLYTSQSYINAITLTSDGELVIITSSERTGRPEFDLLALDRQNGEIVAMLSEEHGGNLQIGLASPVPGDCRILATTTRSGIERLLIWDVHNGGRVDFELPEIPGAILPFDWSQDGQRLLFGAAERAATHLYHLDLTMARPHQFAYGPGTVTGAYFLPVGKEVLAHWEDSAHPSRLVMLDPRNGAIRHILLGTVEVPAGKAWHSVTFASSDGQEIQAWVAIPSGVGPYPTILAMHGGPDAVQRNVFAPEAQVWLDHGFAYCSVNYRGSTTFGYEFQRKIWGRLGEFELADMVAARHYLVTQGIARPETILLTGASYGGYLTLLGLGRQPELWAGGIALIAIADWTALYADEAEALRGYHRAIFGGTPEETPEQHRVSSPITYAENVQAPLLIIQGRNDTRTPARQLELYEARLRTLGKEITVYWFDTGHAGPFTDTEAAISYTEMMLRFAHDIVDSCVTSNS